MLISTGAYINRGHCEEVSELSLRAFKEYHFSVKSQKRIFGGNMVSYDPQGLNDVELCALNVARSRYDDITAGLEDIERSVRIARLAAVLSDEDVKQLMQFESRCKHHWRALYFQRNPTNNNIKMKVHLRRRGTTYYAEEIVDDPD